MENNIVSSVSSDNVSVSSEGSAMPTDLASMVAAFAALDVHVWRSFVKTVNANRLDGGQELPEFVSEVLGLDISSPARTVRLMDGRNLAIKVTNREETSVKSSSGRGRPRLVKTVTCSVVDLDNLTREVAVFSNEPAGGTFPEWVAMIATEVKTERKSSAPARNSREPETTVGPNGAKVRVIR